MALLVIFYPPPVIEMHRQKFGGGAWEEAESPEFEHKNNYLKHFKYNIRKDKLLALHHLKMYRISAYGKTVPKMCWNEISIRTNCEEDII